MLMRNQDIELGLEALMTAADHASRAIPPVWPLASSVAVNPYLGQTNLDLPSTAALLGRVAGAPATMPRHWYHAKIANRQILDEDLEAALAETIRAGYDLGEHATIAAIKAAAAKNDPSREALPTVADLASKASGVDWTGLISERVGAWAADYFDAGQALWAAPTGKTAYAAWRAVAIHDLTPEIVGLKGFAARIADAPERSDAAILAAAKELGLGEDMLETYFHQLLMSLGGWAQFARYKLWRAELTDETSDILTDLLAIRLAWESALLAQYEDRISDQWDKTRSAHAEPPAPDAGLLMDSILQVAAERSAQRDLITTLQAKAPSAPCTRDQLQAAFCIDVRSEVFRRALESVEPGIKTIGFAGFFGLPTAHRRFASDVEELRLPVLLNPGVSTCTGKREDADKDQAKRFADRAQRAWGRFKFAAVSSFAFVEAMGMVYAAELVRDALSLPRGKKPADPAPRFDPELNLETRVNAAETVLRAMFLTEDFARVVLLVGHGANVVNNPHASALHCGACGGYSGEVNARLLAGLLNDREVRKGLREKGIMIPDDTLFAGALHDTTTDVVTLYSDDHGAAAHSGDLKKVHDWLSKAGELARAQRVLRLPRAAAPSDIERRSRDWAEVRPEWALAGCRAFIAAPRFRTTGKDFDGRAFLHDYAWRQDEGFRVLELIMTAPVVVASWISLQYYGSTVAPDIFGAGNKLLHNVSGGIGVVEGNGGALRAGLPWQSVHDGSEFVHEPLRLSVLIEAPTEAMSDILERHPQVRALFDNQWLHLFAIDGAGCVHARYAGGLAWETIADEARDAA
jgi:uncharacterized protein YbcC (UPF0753/DUF2309 family)